jgi:hypothetical protein
LPKVEAASTKSDDPGTKPDALLALIQETRRGAVLTQAAQDASKDK